MLFYPLFISHLCIVNFGGKLNCFLKPVVGNPQWSILVTIYNIFQILENMNEFYTANGNVILQLFNLFWILSFFIEQPLNSDLNITPTPSVYPHCYCSGFVHVPFFTLSPCHSLTPEWSLYSADSTHRITLLKNFWCFLIFYR